MAENIGLFGLRKKLKKAEEEALEIVKEVTESAEKGVEAEERQIEATSIVNGILGIAIVTAVLVPLSLTTYRQTQT